MLYRQFVTYEPTSHFILSGIKMGFFFFFNACRFQSRSIRVSCIRLAGKIWKEYFWDWSAWYSSLFAHV